MRRIPATACSLIFSALALVGGVGGMVLCLHQAGMLHFATSDSAALSGAVRADESVEACGPNDVHECNWHIDVTVEGIGLAELPFEEGQDFTPPLPEIVALALTDWPIPVRQDRKWQKQRAPPTLSNALVVAQTTVLII